MLISLLLPLSGLFLTLAGQNKPGPSQNLSSAGEYTIYSNGVLKGRSSFATFGADRLAFEGEFGPGGWHGEAVFENRRLSSAKFEQTGNAATTVAYSVRAGSLTRMIPEPPITEKLPDGGSLYFPMAPILLQRLLSRYPANAVGFQELPAMDMITGKPRPMTAEMHHVDPRTIKGKRIKVRVWRVRSAPSPEAIVYTDESNLPLFWWSPAVQFEMSLAGYEELRPSFPYQSVLSPAAYKVKIDRDVLIPMSDGVKLMADVYRPDAPGKFPVLLQRTCYDRSEFGNGDGEFYAQRGYVYVTQHVRGRGNSEGDFTPFIFEAADGTESVKWCSSQAWSNGKVGMLGASYNAYCEWMAAKMRPPALKTMISTVPMPGPPDGAPWSGGAFYVSGMLSWYGLLRDKAKTQPFNEDMTAALNTLPLASADSALFGTHIPSFDYWVERYKYDASVRQAAYRDEIDKIDIPILHVSGWLDSVGVGTRLNYTQMVGNGSKNQKLIWGPWSHFTNRESEVGEWDFGPEAYIDLKTTYLRWFDRWLKDIHNGIDTEPEVSTYLINDSHWHYGAEWPDRSMELQRWYLHGPSGPQTVGVLARKRPGSGQPETYAYNPANYIYSANNQVSFFFGWLSGLDLSALCSTAQSDRLLFKTEPLKAPLRLCGPVFAQLCAATTAEDTDWAVALLDVAPSGKTLAIACGMVRGRFHESLEAPKPLTPNTPVTYHIDMWQTGVTIPAGHRLQVVVLSTLFPDTDRNLNTGGSVSHGTGIVAASQTVFHDASNESYIVLPVLKAVDSSDRSPRIVGRLDKSQVMK